MRIESVEYSKIFKAYASYECMDMLDKSYKDKETIASITNIDGDLCIRLAINYDPTIFGYLRMYMSRIQKITVGTMYLYEYEMGITSTRGDKNFIIRTEEGQEFTCTMSNVYMSGSDSIAIIFKILN